MTGMTIAGLYFFQILGLGFSMSAGFCRKKWWILLLNLCANVCSVSVMVLAGRYDGAVAVLICTIRSLLYLFQDRARTNLIFWGCVGAHVIAGVLAWQSWMSFLIIVAPVVLCYVTWFGKVKQIKYGTIISDLCWMIFDVSSGIYIEAARDVAEGVSNVVGLLRAQRAGAPVEKEAV